MTGFEVERLPFAADAVQAWGAADPRHRNWPVVYVLNNDREVYVGESLNAHGRMRQHLDSAEKSRLDWVRVVLDDTFNKSTCLDLESFLIRMFSGDGHLQVLNHNAGITDADYYRRETYQQTFDAVFEQLRTQEHLFQRSLPEIINSDLFKLSPFKAPEDLANRMLKSDVSLLDDESQVMFVARAAVAGSPTGSTCPSSTAASRRRCVSRRTTRSESPRHKARNHLPGGAR